MLMIRLSKSIDVSSIQSWMVALGRKGLSSSIKVAAKNYSKSTPISKMIFYSKVLIATTTLDRTSLTKKVSHRRLI